MWKTRPGGLGDHLRRRCTKPLTLATGVGQPRGLVRRRAGQTTGGRLGRRREVQGRKRGRQEGLGRGAAASSATEGLGEMDEAGRGVRPGRTGPAVTLIGAIAAAALLKPRAPLRVHSRPSSRHPLLPAAAAQRTATARASPEPHRRPSLHIPVKPHTGSRGHNRPAPGRPREVGPETRCRRNPARGGPPPKGRPRPRVGGGAGTTGLFALGAGQMGRTNSYLPTRLERRSGPN